MKKIKKAIQIKGEGDAPNTLVVEAKSGKIGVFQKIDNVWRQLPLMVSVGEDSDTLDQMVAYMDKWGGAWPDAHKKKPSIDSLVSAVDIRPCLGVTSFRHKDRLYAKLVDSEMSDILACWIREEVTFFLLKDMKLYATQYKMPDITISITGMSSIVSRLYHNKKLMETYADIYKLYPAIITEVNTSE